MKVKSVLLVDDEDDIRRIGELSLSRVGGFTTLLAANGVEALELARTRRPDLILLDVMMPVMDGPAVFQSLRDDETVCDIPIIFLTAKAQKTEVEALLALGANGVISKPFDPMTLPTQVASLVARLPAIAVA